MAQTRHTEEFNKAYQTAVAVDTRHIGDDNDYSCWLSRTVYKMWSNGIGQEAYELFLTDPLMNYSPTVEEFVSMMFERQSREIEERAEARAYAKLLSV